MATTALLAHVTHGPKASATAVGENGERSPIDAAALADHVTVDGLAKSASKSEGKGKGGGKAAKKRAAVAVARKLAVLMHRLWTTGANYEPLHNATRFAVPATV